jgi:hypothetical protein
MRHLFGSDRLHLIDHLISALFQGLLIDKAAAL